MKNKLPKNTLFCKQKTTLSVLKIENKPKFREVSSSSGYNKWEQLLKFRIWTTVKLGYIELGYNELGYKEHPVITNTRL